MSLCLVHRPDPLDVALAPAHIEEPGGTIGRCAGNALVLPDTRGHVGRLQAVVRWRGARASVQTLGGGCPVSVNGRPLALGEDRLLAAGDELLVGAFRLAVEQRAGQDVSLADAASVLPVASAVAVAEPAGGLAAHPFDRAPAGGAGGFGPPLHEGLAGDPAAGDPAPGDPFAGVPPAASTSAAARQDTPDDIFAGLFGPGTLPVGSTPDVSSHPFDLASAAQRNPADPLASLPPEARSAGQPADPLALFGDAGNAPGQDIFSDSSPSALDDRRQPAAGAGPITGTLAPAHAPRSTPDHSTQLSGHLRPARPADPDQSNEKEN